MTWFPEDEQRIGGAMMRARDREAHALEMRVTDERRTDARKSFLIG